LPLGAKKFLNLQFVLVHSLYDLLIIFMLVFQTTLLSVFLIVLHKKLDKTLQEIRRSVNIFTDRADDLRLMIANLSDIVLNNNMAQEKNHPNVAAIPPKDSFLSEETHSESLENNNDSISAKNTDNSKDSLKGSLDLFSPPSPPSPPPPPPYVSPQTSAPLSSSAQTEKSIIDSSADLENGLDGSNHHKEKNTHKPEQPEFDNRSAKELKSLENEILCALKRLEKTKSHLAVGQGQGQETEQERENKTT
jgi:hypothetical protein